MSFETGNDLRKNFLSNDHLIWGIISGSLKKYCFTLSNLELFLSDKLTFTEHKFVASYLDKISSFFQIIYYNSKFLENPEEMFTWYCSNFVKL